MPKSLCATAPPGPPASEQGGSAGGLRDKSSSHPTQLRLGEQTGHRTEEPSQEKNRLPLPSATKAARSTGLGTPAQGLTRDSEKPRQLLTLVAASRLHHHQAEKPLHPGPEHPRRPPHPPALLFLKTGSGTGRREACMAESQSGSGAAHLPGACRTMTGSD